MHLLLTPRPSDLEDLGLVGTVTFHNYNLDLS